MMNLARVLSNPKFRQTFKVFRTTGHFDLGGFVEEIPSPAYFEMSGVVWPPSAKELEQVPEGDRVVGMMVFVSSQPIYTTRKTDTEEGNSDQIEWQGGKYKIIQQLNWSDYGFYYCVGVRIAGF